MEDNEIFENLSEQEILQMYNDVLQGADNLLIAKYYHHEACTYTGNGGSSGGTLY